MSVERWWYEASPYVYLVVGSAIGARAADSLLLGTSSLTLVGAAITIIALRVFHRRGARDRFDERGYVRPVTQDLFFDATRSRPLDASRRRR